MALIAQLAESALFFPPRRIVCEWAPLMGGNHPYELGQLAQG
jgi:hypothetical protein